MNRCIDHFSIFLVTLFFFLTQGFGCGLDTDRKQKRQFHKNQENWTATSRTKVQEGQEYIRNEP